MRVGPSWVPNKCRVDSLGYRVIPVDGQAQVRSVISSRVSFSQPSLDRKAFLSNLHTFHDAEVTLRAAAEGLQRLFVGLAFASCQRSVVAVEFDNNRP